MQPLSQRGLCSFITLFLRFHGPWRMPSTCALLPHVTVWWEVLSLLIWKYQSSSLDSAYSLITNSFLYWAIIKTPIYMENGTCPLLLCWRSDLRVPSGTSTSLSSSPPSDSSPESMFVDLKGGLFGMDPTYSFFPVEFSVKRNRNSAPLFHFPPCQIRGWCRG